MCVCYEGGEGGEGESNSVFPLSSLLSFFPFFSSISLSPLPPLLDLCIPKNSAQFVISISEQLARSDPHLTVEFLSEVVAGFQQYTFALKQLCLAYMSPWLPILSRFVARSEGATTCTEQEKVMKLIDLLVALTISEEEVVSLLHLRNEFALIVRKGVIL